MGSSKKKGQQRKAAKKALAAAAASGDVHSTISGGGGSSKIVAKVRSGDNKATKRFISGLTELGMDNMPLVSLEGSGVLSMVLEFLKRCEDDTFDQVLSSVGGDLKSPAIWIHMLSTGILNEPRCKLQIAESIGPLVRCFCNDIERIFFKSNKHWREGIAVFVSLVANVMKKNTANTTLESDQIIYTMLQYDGILTSIVQMGFWSEHRPDIMQDKTEGIAYEVIISMSREIIELLVSNAMEGGESRNWLLEIICTTPIVNKAYDANCMVSYTAGLVRHLKTHSKAKERDALGEILLCLIREADCVDKDVISEIIDLGLNHTYDYALTYNVTLISLKMINQNHTAQSLPSDVYQTSLTENFPSDARIASAVRAGLIEMCLGFIERFGDHGVFDKGETSMRVVIKCIFKCISNVSLHQKTAKAIRSKSNNIKEKLDSFKGKKDIKNNIKWGGLLDMIRGILYINGSYCCRCNKSLCKTEVMECNGCHRMTYCSKACQREDWRNGHNLSCCKRGTHETGGFFQGRFLPTSLPDNVRATAQLSGIEINMTMIQLKLFLDHSETILIHAKELDIPLNDCVVYFGLRDSPLTFEVKDYMTVFASGCALEGFQKSRSKDNIMCVYYSTIYSGELIDGVAMQRFFPLEWLMK